MLDYSRPWTNRTRVCFITRGFGLGGAERWLLSLAKQFQSCEAHSLLITEPYLHPFVMYEGSRHFNEIHLFPKIESLPPYGTTHKTEAAAISAATRDANIVITWGFTDLPKYRHLIRCPIVDVSHCDPKLDFSSIHLKSCVGADYLAAVSRTAAGSFPTSLQSEVTVIYNGAEVDRIAPRHPRDILRNAWKINDKFVLLYMVRYSPEKRPLRVLDMLSFLPDYFHVIMAGTGTLEDQVKARGREDYPGRVTFMYPQPHVGDLLNACDAFILPTVSEGFSIAMCEAWLAGVPALITPCDTFRELSQFHGQPLTSLPEDADPFAMSGVVSKLAEHVGHDRENTTWPYDVNVMRKQAWQQHTAAGMAARWEKYIHNCIMGFHTEPLYPTLSRLVLPEQKPSNADLHPEGARLDDVPGIPE